MQGIFKSVGKQAAQIRDLESGKIRSSGTNGDIHLLCGCFFNVRGQNQVDRIVAAIAGDLRVRKSRADFLNIGECLLRFVFLDTILKKIHMVAQIVPVDRGLLLGVKEL